MAILKVARMGNPCLRQVCTPYTPEEILGGEAQRLVDDMIETALEYDGAGLAAPQVHVTRRLVVMEWANRKRKSDTHGLLPVFNPVVTPMTDKTLVHYEGCLSLPDLRGEVTRFSKVRIQGFDRDGKPIDEAVQGFQAAVVQHECDHLDGILYVDRLTSVKSLSFLKEFLREQGYDDDSD